MELRSQLQDALGASYLFERELGGGGMSRVFVAEDRTLGRRIVLKVLSPELAADVSGERFAREIRLAARLQQVNIVPLLTAGEVLGLPYYTMPYVEGQSLRHRLTEHGALAIDETLSVLRDVARALVYAHEHGVIHRDIKPENVLLSGDAAMVTDFGIAKAIAASRTGAPGETLTSAGMAVGTPGYTAPEQALGDPLVDHRADAYSFGCLAYELLTGNPPFHGRSPQQQLVAHVHEPVPTVGSLRPDTPGAVGALVMRCLAKDPDARPQSAREILQTLNAMATPGTSALHLPVSARQPRVFLALAAVLVAATGWLVLHRAAAAAAAQPRTLAVMPFASISADTGQSYFADGIAIDLTNALSKVPGLRVTSRSLAFTYKGKPIDARAVGRELGVDALLEGTVQRSGGRLRVTSQLTRTADGVSMWSDEYQRDTKDLFTVQDEIARSIVNELQPRLVPRSDAAPRAAVAGTTNPEAVDAYYRGIYLLDNRGPGVAAAVRMFQQAIAKDSNYARAYGALSEALELMPYFSDTPARAVEAQAVGAANRALALDSTVAEAYIALGLAHDHAFRWDVAENDYRRAIAVDSNSAVAFLQYGRHLMHTARLSAATQAFRRATQLDPGSGTAIVWLAHMYALSGKTDSALLLNQHAREVNPGLLLARTIGAEDAIIARRPDVARNLVTGLVASPAWRGQAAFALGQAGDTATVKSVIRELERLPRNTWMVHTGVAYAALGIGDTARALSELEAAVRARELTPKWDTMSDPMFDPVRRSPRFASVIRGFGLDVAVLTSPNGGRPVH